MAFDKRAWMEANRAAKKIYDRERYLRLRDEKLAYAKTQREADPNYMKEYWRNNREKQREYARQGRAKHGDKYREIVKAWKERNPDRVLASINKRRTIKLNAMPVALRDCPIEQERIAAFYTEAKRKQRETGDKWHVDHIVPLVGKDVCGLHVSWNLQVLPAVENLRKSNRTR